jgi:hypothetical protein
MKTIKSHYPPVISFHSVGMKSLIEELEEFSFRILDGFLVGKKRSAWRNDVGNPVLLKGT